MNQPPVIGIYGETNTGKTTLAVKIITYFSKQGLHIATIKQTDKTICIDVAGKDTDKHRQAGATVVILSSKHNTDIMINKKIEISSHLNILSKIQEFNLILIEGATDPDIPKIRMGNIAKRENTIADYKGNFDEIKDIIQKEIHKQKKLQKISILVNGKKIYLSEFPVEIIQNTIIGMLSSLKGINNIETVEIQIKKR